MKRPAVLKLMLVALQALVYFIPLVALFIVSFLETDFISVKVVGLKNFLALVKDGAFISSIANTVFYVLVVCALQVVASIVLGVGLYRMRPRARRVVSFLIYVPSIMAGMILSSFFVYVFKSGGLANQIQAALHLPLIDFLGSRFWVLFAVAFSLTLETAGASALLIYAGLANIPKTFMEQAAVDGASKMQQARHILIPGILPQIKVLLFTWISGALSMWEHYFLMARTTSGAPMMYDAYYTGYYSSKYGSSCAKIIVIILLGVIISKASGSKAFGSFGAAS